MKKYVSNPVLIVWIAVGITTLYFGISKTGACYNSGGGLETLACPVYFGLYVGGFIYLSCVLAIIIAIVRNIGNIAIDKAEKSRRLVALFVLLGFVLIPVAYIFWGYVVH